MTVPKAPPVKTEVELSNLERNSLPDYHYSETTSDSLVLDAEFEPNYDMLDSLIVEETSPDVTSTSIIAATKMPGDVATMKPLKTRRTTTRRMTKTTTTTTTKITTTTTTTTSTTTTTKTRTKIAQWVSGMDLGMFCQSQDGEKHHNVVRSHPEKCTQFLYCWKGTVYEIECKPGMNFNVEISRCDPNFECTNKN